MNLYQEAGRAALLGLLPDDVLFVRYVFSRSQLVGFAEVHETKGWTRLRFLRATLVTVVGLDYARARAKHIRFVRSARPEAGQPRLNPVRVWPRMRVALRHTEIEKIAASGGLDRVPTYQDELLVADFAISGTTGWIVPKKDIGRCLAQLPPLRSSGTLGTVWIDSARAVDDTDKCLIWMFHKDPRITDRGFLAQARQHLRGAFLHEIFAVNYDQGSLLIKGITECLRGQTAQCIQWSAKPGPQYLTVGKRLPVALRPPVATTEGGRRG